MGRVQTAETGVTLKDGRTRRFRSKQERRQIVEETLKPGASVSLVARGHDVARQPLGTGPELHPLQLQDEQP